MSGPAPFLAAARAAPADDLPRLVLADWLDDHGDHPRADLIRTQVELEPVRDDLADPHTQQLLARERDLLAAHRRDWLGPAADLDGPDGRLGPVFHRGLPDRIVLSLDALLARGDELLDALPTVREVAVYGVQNRGAELAGCAALDRLETLEIADWPTPEDAHLLTRSRHFGGQSVVRLWDVPAPDPDAGSVLDAVYPAAWRPRGRVELVQLYGGLIAGHRGDAAVARFADRFRAVWGPGTIRVVRPFDRTFPLWAAGEHGLWTGSFHGDRDALLIDGPGVVEVASFRGGGYVGSTVRPRRGRPLAEWVEGLGEAFRSGPIRVGEFRTPSGVRLGLWAAADAEVFLHPFVRPAWMTPAEWADRGRQLKGWLDAGRCFLSDARRSFLVDRYGRVEPA